MLFPRLTRKFVKEVELEEDLMESKHEETKKYPADTLKYLSPRIVEFRTPPNTRGLGTESHIKAGNQPIQGLVVLTLDGGAPTAVSQLSTNLGEGEQTLVPFILKLNAECMSSDEGC
jgi:hypothetical protein